MVQLPSAPRLSGNSRPASAGRLLGALQHAAGLDRHRHVRRIEAAHAVQARQAQHHLAAAVVGHRAADQAGVAALRHDGRAVLGAQAHHLRHFGGGAGPHDGERPAAPALAPVDLPGAEVAVGEQVGGADDAAQAIEQLAHVAPAPAWRKRARTCTAQATKISVASTTSRPASQRADAALAGRPHRAFGDVEPDQQADPAVGVEAHPGQTGQRQEQAAAP